MVHRTLMRVRTPGSSRAGMRTGSSTARGTIYLRKRREPLPEPSWMPAAEARDDGAHRGASSTRKAERRRAPRASFTRSLLTFATGAIQ